MRGVSEHPTPLQSSTTSGIIKSKNAMSYDDLRTHPTCHSCIRFSAQPYQPYEVPAARNRGCHTGAALKIAHLSTLWMLCMSLARTGCGPRGLSKRGFGIPWSLDWSRLWPLESPTHVCESIMEPSGPQTLENLSKNMARNVFSRHPALWVLA